MGENLKPKVEAVVKPEKGGLLEITDQFTDARIAHAELMRRSQHGQSELVINKFEVVPEYENMGFGKMLMDSIKEILRNEKRVGMLSVHASNRNAQGFYESQGWEFEDSEENEMPNRGQSANNLQRWMIYETSDEED